jgi:proteasome lid subunit RPN8/RPN11
MVKVSAEIIELVKKHGEETYPEECCGVLIGKFNQDVKEVFEVLRIENSKESERNRRF